VGANVGIYTILLSRLCPRSKIMSIEASPDIFDILQSNCKLNNLRIGGTNLFLINKAVSEKDGVAAVFYECHSMSTMCKEFLTSVSNSIITYKEELIKKTVRTVTIDSLVETHNVGEISLLKIDVEGSEVSALKGAIDTLYKKKVRNMLIEYHSSENYDYIVRMLEELGYKVATSQERFNMKTSDNMNFVNGHIMATLKE
jgi:FkbM family methyltransferase